MTVLSIDKDGNIELDLRGRIFDATVNGGVLHLMEAIPVAGQPAVNLRLLLDPEMMSGLIKRINANNQPQHDQPFTETDLKLVAAEVLTRLGPYKSIMGPALRSVVEKAEKWVSP